MFNKLLIFFKRIFKDKKVKLLETSIELKDSNIQKFKNDIRYDNGKKGRELLEEILNEKNNNTPRKPEEKYEIQEKLVEYIDILIKRIDKCQNDITIKRLEL